MTTPRSPADRNRASYNAPDVVEEYAELDELTEVERRLFGQHLQPGWAILDLGVGAGRTTPALHELADRYVGIDFAERMVDRCRERFPDVEFQVGDAADLSRFDDGSFDAVVFSFNGIDTLHPDEARRQCLRECHRVLRDRGIFILSRRNPRAVLETAAAGGSTRSGSIGTARFVYRSARRAVRTMLHAPFWKGRGFEHTSVHGGIFMARATPRHAVKEIEEVGFDHLQTLPSTYPRRGSAFSSYWYYFAFRRC